MIPLDFPDQGEPRREVKIDYPKIMVEKFQVTSNAITSFVRSISIFNWLILLMILLAAYKTKINLAWDISLVVLMVSFCTKELLQIEAIQKITRKRRTNNGRSNIVIRKTNNTRSR